MTRLAAARRAWRERPRESLWATSRAKGGVLILTGGAWVIAAQNAWAAVSGAVGPAGYDGLGAAAAALVAFAVAVPGTWLVWAYVRRPVDPPEVRPRDVEDRDPGIRAREDAERSAWRTR